MSKVYTMIHGNNDPETAIIYKKVKSRKQNYIRSLLKEGIISLDTFNELMDIIQMGSLDELEAIDLPRMKHDKDIVDKVRAMITPRDVPKRKLWQAGIRVKVAGSLDSLDGNEKLERNNWISKTRRLYDRLIRINICTHSEKDEYEANLKSIQTPLDAERAYLNLYLKHHERYQTVMNGAYCAKCPHCDKLKNLMTEAFNADVEDLQRREREE